MTPRTKRLLRQFFGHLWKGTYTLFLVVVATLVCLILATLLTWAVVTYPAMAIPSILIGIVVGYAIAKSGEDLNWW